MFVVYKVYIPEMKYERIEAFETFEEAKDYLAEHQEDEDSYTVFKE